MSALPKDENLVLHCIISFIYVEVPMTIHSPIMLSRPPKCFGLLGPLRALDFFGQGPAILQVTIKKIKAISVMFCSIHWTNERSQYHI